MLNMKKGLAIVLAAATVFTFAPVSTLGLTGVVEAQAADVDSLSDWTTAGSADVADTQTITVVSDTTAKSVKLNITNDDATNDATIVVTNLPTGATANASNPTTIAAKKSGTLTFDIAANAANVAATEVTVKSTVNGTAHTYKFKLGIKDQDTVKYENAENAITGIDSNVYIQRSKGSSLTLTPSYVTENGRANNASGYKFTVESSQPAQTAQDTGVASVPDTDLTVESGTLTVDTTTSGSVKLSVKAETTPASGTVAWLAAYKLDSSKGAYVLVGYNKIKIITYAVSSNLVLSDDYNSGISVQLGQSTSSSIFANAKVFDSRTGTQITSITPDANGSIAFENEAIAKLESDGRLTGTKLGSELATVTFPYTVNGVQAIATKTLRVNVITSNSAVIKVTADGTKDAADFGTAKAPIRLNVKNNSTFNLSKYVYVSDPANTTIAYKSDNNRNTVSDAGIVTATVAVDQFKVTVQAKDKKTGVVLASTDVYFRVNSLPDDVLAVSGASIAAPATVISDTDYAYTGTKVSLGSATEATLAASQINYVQFEVRGDESDDIEADLHVTSANGAKLAYSFADRSSTAVFKEISQAGVLTIGHGYTSGAAVIKVVSSATANSEVTTSYFYVVIDKAAPSISGMFESAYKIGTDAGAVSFKDYESKIEFKKDGYTVTSKYLTKANDDRTAAQNLYNTDSPSNFVQDLTTSAGNNKTVAVANAEGKTEHVLVAVSLPNSGTAYQVVTITSVPGVRNSVTKIEDATNDEVIYTPDMGVTIPELILKGNTTLKVTLAYSIDKNATKAEIKSTSLYNGADALNQNIFTRANVAPKKGETYNTFYLYPTTKGTQQVTVEPSGDISASDHSIIGNDAVTLELTYNTASQKPSQITGVKVGNKKGAKVVVKFNNDNTSKNIKYYVQKKVGKKTSGKSVGSNRTILSVKKGKTVKVRVKAYYYDANGTKHVGKYSKWVTKKTDKK